MIASVKKRNGKIVQFNPEKITDAIFKAAVAVGGEDKERARWLTDKVIEILEEKKNQTPTIEQIQDIVEKVLIDNGHVKTARAYITYRQQHRNLRELGFILNSNSIIDSYLNLSDWEIRENSNMNFSIQGLNNYLSNTITKTYWLNKIYPPEIREKHKSGDFHIHDLGMLSVYCCGWDLKELLTKGFGGVSGKIESAPAKHLRTALGHIVNFFYTLQGEAAGAQAFSNFDTFLAPFVYYDKLTYKDVKQAIQEFVFNVNVPTRVGFQTPFTNITMDLKVPSHMKDEPAIIGGKYMEKTLGEFQKEMDMINRAFAEVMMEGDSKGRIFTFPIPTYNITKDFDWENPVLEPVWKMTAKYGIPYFSNFVNSDMDPEDARSMCCRLRLDNRELAKRGGGLFGSNPLTGSIGVVTINLPRLGYNFKDDKKGLFERLDELMDLAKESLTIKRKILEKYTDAGLYPFSKVYLDSIKQRTGKYWGNHFCTIGILGMNECLLNFFDKDITTDEGQEFAKEILNHMRDKLSEYQEETGEMFNLEATPAEGTSYRLARKDIKKHPKIKVANMIDMKSKGVSPYYTNSSQLPVGFTEDLFNALDLQDGLQTLYTGGTVFHGFIGEKMPDVESVKTLVKKIAENYHLPYYTISPTFSVCPQHGYISGEHYTCDKCGQECEVYARIVGYIRPVKNWNDGKQAEYKNRKMFEVIAA